jgi:Rod binding domain-containing protein
MDVSAALTGQIGQAQAAALAARQKSLNASLADTADGVSESDKQKMAGKAKEFEAFYVYQFLELMAPKEQAQFGGGMGEEMFRHQLNEEIAKNMTQAGGFGIADTVYNELLHQQQDAMARHNATAAIMAKQAYTETTAD